MEIRKAHELRENYEVYALFYERNIVPLGMVNCRCVADIVRKENREKKIDAYFIMMNPGSCHALDPKYHAKDDIEYREIEFIRCQDDPAQQQIMRIMDNMNWNKVRILNLSDIQSGNSKEFKNLVKTVSSNEHSIFSDKRREEFDYFTKDDAVFVYAWGKDISLSNLALLCVNRTQERKHVGIKGSKDYTYEYVKPMLFEKQVIMVERMVNYLRGELVD